MLVSVVAAVYEFVPRYGVYVGGSDRAGISKALYQTSGDVTLGQLRSPAQHCLGVGGHRSRAPLQCMESIDRHLYCSRNLADLTPMLTSNFGGPVLPHSPCFG